MIHGARRDLVAELAPAQVQREVRPQLFLGLADLTLKDLAGAPEDPEHTFAAVFSRGPDGALSICDVTPHRSPLDEEVLAALLDRLRPTQLVSFRLNGTTDLPPPVTDALSRQTRLP